MNIWKPGPQSLEIGLDEIHLWRFEVDRNLGAVPDLGRTLDRTEAAHASRIRSGRERCRYILGRGGLRTILARYLKAGPDRLRFRYGPHGKPELETDELYFSLSHSDDVILYAFSRTHWVGVDVERMLPGVADEISRHFLPRSACRLAALSRAERQRAFYQAWTRMGAYAKSSGAGLDSDLRDLENFLSPALAVGSRSYRTPDQWIRDLCPRTDYVGALAGAGACKIKYWSWQANN